MLVLSLSACVTRDTTDGGEPYVSAELFPFDGERTSTFRSTDATLPYELVVVSVPPPEVTDTLNVYTVHYERSCVSDDPACVDGEIFSLQWSSREGDGVFVFGADGVTFDPPVRVANDHTGVGDVAETVTAGARWTSTMEGMFECPVAMAVEWESCARFVIESDGEGGPLVGTWWAAASHGTVAFEPAGETGRWELSAFDCAGECDGSW
jgi:hypothetical protein